MAVSVQMFAILAIAFFIMLVVPELFIWEIILAFLMFVPSTAQGLISGTSYSTSGVLNLSMVGYITILAALILLFRHKYLEKTTTSVIMGCFVVILMARVIADGTDFLSNKLFDNYFIPMLLAILMVSYLNAISIPRLMRFFYICIMIGAIIACIEYVYGKSLLFHEYYMVTCPWYVNIYVSSEYVAFRSCSLFGHPLSGAMYYLLGIVYLFNFEDVKKNKFAAILQFGLLTAAILTTNARSALLGLTLYIVYYLIKNKRIGKLFVLIMVVPTLSLIVDWGGIYNTLFARDSSGSSYMVRIRALLSIVNIPIESFIFGEGFNNTFSLLKRLGFSGNVEISYLIILIENGFFGFCAWLASIMYLYKKGMIKSNIGELKVASMVQGMLLSLFIAGGMSNSFGDPGTLNYTIYILLAFSSILAKATQEGSDSNNWMDNRRLKIRFRLRR